MSEETEKNKVSQRPKPLRMRCTDCREEILQKDPPKCPYCGSTNLISEEENIPNLLEEIEKLERAGRYEDAALRYEELEMWDKAGEVRRKDKTSYVISANINIGKVSTISMECPHCGASQPLSSKNNEITCKYCGKNYIIPKKVLDLL
jgi:Zn finger protein HypA/HybF involved in hydrogenase expression